MPRIKVALKERSYTIDCVTNNNNVLRDLVVKQLGKGRLFIIFDANAFALHGKKLISSLKLPESRVFLLAIPSGERYKNQSTLNKIQNAMLAERIERNDFVLVCGGGVTTDLGGYAAASILRGISWGAVPTTLLGMVDAAIGGKTGINHFKGKNLLGAIWQPKFVYSDTSFLQTLPERQILAGCGEILKYAGLVGNPVIGLLESYMNHGDLYDSPKLLKLITVSARYKSDIVSKDEREQGKRLFLNFGHTFAHAIEKSLGYGKLLHGEAVVLGIYAALELGKMCGIESKNSCNDYREFVMEFISCLPKRKMNVSEIYSSMSSDKKRQSGHQKFVLLARPGRPQIADRVEMKLVKRAISEMLKVYYQSGDSRA